MWCKSCNIETNEKVCPVCGSETVEDVPVEIYWCTHCLTPIIQTTNQADKGNPNPSVVASITGLKTMLNLLKYSNKRSLPPFSSGRILISGFTY